jgi:AcrR family transcriptional regulator
MSRTGRRPGTPDTRDTIISVARKRFATRGYDATSLRSIATEAKVDPALLIHYFGTKEGLFTAAIGLSIRPSEMMFADLQSLPLRDAVETIIRGYLQLIDSDDSRNAVLALVRSAVSNEKAATVLREFVTAELLGPLSDLTDHPDAPLRASLVVAQLVGIAVHRHVVRVGPLAQATADEVVTLMTPVIEQCLA